MYEALQKLCPDDADVLNNLAFCLIPLDPRRAIPLLEKALEMEAGAVRYANLALCHILVGEFGEAKRYLEIPTGIQVPPFVYLWRKDNDGNLQLERVQDFSGYMHNLSALARGEGESVEE